MNTPIKLTKAELDQIKEVRKRDGQKVPFEIERIKNVVLKAFNATNEGSEKQAQEIAALVIKDLIKIKKVNKNPNFIPHVEMIQDLVEEQLMYNDFVRTAKSYIVYREERAQLRMKRGVISPEVKKIFQESSKYFASPYAEFIFYRTYSVWRDDLGRRETWIETVDRFMDYMKSKLGEKLSAKDYSSVREGILRQEICPSMRLLWSAGRACQQSNVWAYNCSYIAPTRWQDLGEIMYILMCGAGLGFSVESENIEKFPQIEKQTGEKLEKFTIEDSKIGWADAYVMALKTWSSGKDIDFDYSKIRPSGARLKTAGGTASGPQPLIDLMNFTKTKMLARQGRRLRRIDMHDIICQIGLIVISGGVRRSALISLSDLDDDSMRDSKSGQFWLENGQRSMANNSAVYTEKPEIEQFMDEWFSLVKSKTGERGIFNRGGLEKQIPKRRIEKNINQKQMGTNPCGEIILRSRQFCNLTSIVVRPNDTKETLREKMRLATIVGTYQASLTDFEYLSKEWKKNCEEEALLGVSITGYYDNKLIRTNEVLQDLRDYSIKVNQEYAKKIGINQSTSITTIKPHGNSGQLLAVGSGMHPWFAPYYIRRVRVNVNDPLLQLMKDQGVPCYPEVGYSSANASTMVLEFPIKAPNGAVFNKDVSALELLNEWKRIKENFVEHNPSVTIYVSDDEWLAVADFVYKNWEIIGGLSFLPRTDHVYQMAPYEEISKEKFEQMSAQIKEIDFSKLLHYEFSDNTTGAKEFACVSGVCSIDDILAEEAKKEQEKISS